MNNGRTDICVLLMADLMPDLVKELDRQFVLFDARDSLKRQSLLDSDGHRIEAIATDGHTGASGDLILSLPKLEIISCFSAGLDNIDVATAADRGVAVTNTSAALADDVADLAILKCLLLLRRYLSADRFVRDGQWRGRAFPLGHSAKGKKLGILGLGTIGTAIARRAEVMGMIVSYTSRNQKYDLPYRFIPDLEGLASESDILVVCCPATPETRRIVNADVLKALGPEGYLINIARGSVVDETALIQALKEETIACAGLDVFDNEPNPSQDFSNFPGVVLSPHIGSGTFETRAAMARLTIENILRHFRLDTKFSL